MYPPRHKKIPGISRRNRISDEGLQRLDKHLAAGTRISHKVLAQWVKRYGEAARVVLRSYGIDTETLEGSAKSDE